MFQLTCLQIRFTCTALGEDIILIRDHHQLLTSNSGNDVDQVDGLSKMDWTSTCKWNRSVLLHSQPCDYSPLMYFVIHFVTHPQYQLRVITSVQAELDKRLKLQASSPPKDTTLPVRAVLQFSVPNCDIYTPIDKFWFVD